VGEELHEIVQNSSNEGYTENKQSDGSNVEIDREVMGLKEVRFSGKTMAEKTGSCHCFGIVQSIRLFHISLE